MSQEGVGAHVPALHEAVEHSVPPVEVGEQVDGRGYGGGHVEQEMCDHDDIGLDSDDSASPLHVGLDDMLTGEAMAKLWKVLGAEDGRFELVRLWVVELLQVADRLLFLVQKIWARVSIDCVEAWAW